MASFIASSKDISPPGWTIVMPKLEPSLAGFTTNDSFKGLVSSSADKNGEVSRSLVPAFLISTKSGVGKDKSLHIFLVSDLFIEISHDLESLPVN